MAHAIPETDSQVIDDQTIADVILPSQFQAQVHALRDPERRLRRAILDSAIRSFQRNMYAIYARDRRGQVLYADAVDWFSSQDRVEPFSFENVCAALGLDADSVRIGLCRWREAERARRANERPLTSFRGAAPQRASHAQRRAA